MLHEGDTLLFNTKIEIGEMRGGLCLWVKINKYINIFLTFQKGRETNHPSVAGIWLQHQLSR